MIRAALLEGPSGPGVTADPTDVKGFYPYDVERGADITGYWYRSPGDKGSSDPMRPEDPAAYIGMVPPEPEGPSGGEAPPPPGPVPKE